MSGPRSLYNGNQYLWLAADYFVYVCGCPCHTTLVFIRVDQIILCMSVEGHGFGIQICFASSVQLERWDFENLSAPYWRWYWNETPGWRVQYHDQNVALDPDQVILIPPNTPFSCSSTGSPIHHYIEFTVSGFLNSIPPQIINIPASKFGEQVLTQIAACIQHGSLPHEIQLQQQVLHSLGFIADTLKNLTPIPETIAKVMDFLSHHLDRRFESAYLSQLSGLSHDLFPRYFRKHLGIGLQAWHMQKRIDAICTALHHSKDSLEALAEQYGFSDRYHMTKLFTKHRGIGPASFRRQRYANG